MPAICSKDLPSMYCICTILLVDHMLQLHKNISFVSDNCFESKDVVI